MNVEKTPTRTKYFNEYKFPNNHTTTNIDIKREYFNFIYYMNLPQQIRDKIHYNKHNDFDYK